MKKLLIAIWLMTASTVVYSACSMTTVITDKGMVTCTTCCSGSNCTVTCL